MQSSKIQKVAMTEAAKIIGGTTWTYTYVYQKVGDCVRVFSQKTKRK
ncbi:MULTISPECIES: hypothetical protein [unclassified Cupriavidus]